MRRTQSLPPQGDLIQRHEKRSDRQYRTQQHSPRSPPHSLESATRSGDREQQKSPSSPTRRLIGKIKLPFSASFTKNTKEGERKEREGKEVPLFKSVSWIRRRFGRRRSSIDQKGNEERHPREEDQPGNALNDLFPVAKTPSPPRAETRTLRAALLPSPSICGSDSGYGTSPVDTRTPKWADSTAFFRPVFLPSFPSPPVISPNATPRPPYVALPAPLSPTSPDLSTYRFPPRTPPNRYPQSERQDTSSYFPFLPELREERYGIAQENQTTPSTSKNLSSPTTPFSTHQRLADLRVNTRIESNEGAEEKSSGSSDSEESRGRYIDNRRPELCSRFSDTTRGAESDRSHSIDTHRSNSLHSTYSSLPNSYSSNPPPALPSRPSTTTHDSDGTVRPEAGVARMKSFGTQTTILEEVHVEIIDTSPARMREA